MDPSKPTPLWMNSTIEMNQEETAQPINNENPPKDHDQLAGCCGEQQSPYRLRSSPKQRQELDFI